MMKKQRNSHHYRLIFICLFLSILSWFAVKMSKDYTQPYQFDVTFINIPNGKELTYQSDTTISLTMSTKGLILLRYEFRRKNISIDYPAIIASNQQNRNYITIKKNQINTYLIQSLSFPENTIVNDPPAITLELEPIKEVKN
jgi:hypothetical protein